MAKHNQIIRWQEPTNCLNVFHHFVGLALKGLNYDLFYSVVSSGQLESWQKLV